eukprot:TRINITY_DN2313_c0_g3_i5.p1 TRINITY_DN2313_c0_g3~~TRINITY_DN2313_c0_g3_i5.p1  ORF type:complete len:553 (-),score=128.75 TRINITY_DN2313_c0_g3_i5:401-2059(-)
MIKLFFVPFKRSGINQTNSFSPRSFLKKKAISPSPSSSSHSFLSVNQQYFGKTNKFISFSKRNDSQKEESKEEVQKSENSNEEQELHQNVQTTKRELTNVEKLLERKMKEREESKDMDDFWKINEEEARLIEEEKLGANRPLIMMKLPPLPTDTDIYTHKPTVKKGEELNIREKMEKDSIYFNPLNYIDDETYSRLGGFRKTQRRKKKILTDWDAPASPKDIAKSHHIRAHEFERIKSSLPLVPIQLKVAETDYNKGKVPSLELDSKGEEEGEEEDEEEGEEEGEKDPIMKGKVEAVDKVGAKQEQEKDIKVKAKKKPKLNIYEDVDKGTKGWDRDEFERSINQVLIDFAKKQNLDSDRLVELLGSNNKEEMIKKKYEEINEKIENLKKRWTEAELRNPPTKVDPREESLRLAQSRLDAIFFETANDQTKLHNLRSLRLVGSDLSKWKLPISLGIMGVGLYHIGYWMIIGALGFIACSKLLDAVVKRWTLRQISPFLSQVESIMTKERSRIESIVGGKVPSLERIKSSKFIPQIFVLPKEPKEYQIRTLYKG